MPATPHWDENMLANSGHVALRRGRVSTPGQIYHVTTVTSGREPFFADWQVGRMLPPLLNDENLLGGARTLAWVLMPDHLHWLLELGEKRSLSEIVRRLKSSSAVRVNKAMGKTGPLWESAFHDHALRHHEDVRSVARYIIANPLRSGLVKSIGDYPLWDAIWLREQVATSWLLQKQICFCRSQLAGDIHAYKKEKAPFRSLPLRIHQRLISPSPGSPPPRQPSSPPRDRRGSGTTSL